MRTRFDLQLKPEDAAVLRFLAESLDVPITEVVRRGVKLVRAELVADRATVKRAAGVQR